MKAICIEEPGKVVVKDIDKPARKPGEALLKMLYGGICGSDLGSYRGANAYVSYPRIPGHELAAEIVEIDENDQGLKPGMIVTDEPGVYEAGQVGIRIENVLECYHKADNQYGTFLAFRPLTFVPIATSPVVPGVLTRDELDWLNAYHREVFEKLAPRLNEEERDWLAKKCAAIGA